MAKKEKGEKQQEQAKAPEIARHSAKERPRLRVKFEKEIAPALMKELESKNTMAVPHLHKIVVNMGVGEATQNAKSSILRSTNWVKLPGRSRWSRARRNRSQLSRFVRVCPSAPWSLCVAIECTNSWTGS